MDKSKQYESLKLKIKEKIEILAENIKIRKPLTPKVKILLAE